MWPVRTGLAPQARGGSGAAGVAEAAPCSEVGLNVVACHLGGRAGQNKEGRTTEGLALRSLERRVESLVRANFMQLPLTFFFAISAYSLYTSSATQTARLFEKPLRVPRA